jgi:hypothetical protein
MNLLKIASKQLLNHMQEFHARFLFQVSQDTTFDYRERYLIMPFTDFLPD